MEMQREDVDRKKKYWMASKWCLEQKLEGPLEYQFNNLKTKKKKKTTLLTNLCLEKML